jgi:sec-independent protein translocase protein TatA
MGTLVASEVEELDGPRGQRARRSLAGEGEHGAVVVRVRVQVQQVEADRIRELLEAIGVASLADVDDALQHLLSLAPGARVVPLGEGDWYGERVNLGAPELIIVLIVILVLFGGSKLPKLARSLGQAQTEFKKGVQATDDEDVEGDKPSA